MLHIVRTRTLQRLRNRSAKEALMRRASDDTVSRALGLLEEWRALRPVDIPSDDLIRRTDIALGRTAYSTGRVWGPGHPDDDPALPSEGGAIPIDHPIYADPPLYAPTTSPVFDGGFDADLFGV